ncbi:50S ribosomal protein L15 [Candidatus Uhrbacteria bacterium RIFCSPLOWO2_01_FULL_47_24]|uniref:Large ribosomal subunit protein uL15 n=1 Tax=Candidatus Uhrbacteria bacterium RIFCSPLOWO2_01_FULL_47_24 TaxID=1802401 RepID=A0A1F7UTN7_9BACT|nr:MAG: 50S ribosomal protein L15 [Candidatus Uhrbacteria bacterium RIFCSPHIGHO2_01_FULL_47_11]OGL68963.1 MAG: 50S ribosomal protein L15 [Candidatus Uhrbacteria bacterium RIFCSPHIGHO2_02_FULL_46_47]OGL74920.1 MAG: 50S ribosomal protein L15 [Candidatus Uhrbacteria bacterium RIFCSPHIGHO2_12_FULL_47_11]OGL81661.1 MAG: 50S ribosomal protein L15 [Candidatus Uhrbacteria bacterium RIFCSPLOWO2_01_FULL_47_24]OGL85086.1 MAG: 50S ribosomal protein L15 [Candidatus Uhrbacteria bacterium RIFCSPLOWO2_02_FULL_
MPFTLSNLKPATGSRTRVRRIGRGPGSGRGKTAGRGTKGQRARSSGRKGLARLGLKRIMQRIPKHRGFTSFHRKPSVVNVGILEQSFATGTKITPQLLETKGIVKNISDGVKILGDGTIAKTFIIKGCEVSKSAKEKIEKVGGKVE